jgi:hypothetical protein
MNIVPQRHLAVKAVLISLALNAGMVVAALLGSLFGERSLLTRVSDLVAAPPGLIAERAFQPRDHSAGALIVSMSASLTFSIVFYAVIVLAILEAVRFGRLRFQRKP